MKLVKYDKALQTIEFEDNGAYIIAQFDGRYWAITYIEVDGVPQYSCLPEFSTRVLSEEAAEFAGVVASLSWETMHPEAIGDDAIQRRLAELHAGQQRLGLVINEGA